MCKFFSAKYLSIRLLPLGIGIVYRWVKYLMAAESSLSGPPYWAKRYLAIPRSVWLTFTDVAVFFIIPHYFFSSPNRILFPWPWIVYIPIGTPRKLSIHYPCIFVHNLLSIDGIFVLTYFYIQGQFCLPDECLKSPSSYVAKSTF